MANKVVANLGAFTAAFLSLLWIITLVRPWTWLWSDNAIVMFKVNLFSIYISKGTIAHGLSIIGHLADKVFGTKAAASMDKLFNHAMWMEDGVQELCMVGVDSIWHWCQTWVMVKYGSMIFIFLGFFTALSLAMGGAFMYYYAHYHATHTGRMWIRACFISAPICAWIGLLQYVMLTFWMGSGERQIIETHANYGPGFVVACALTVLSALPLYIHGVFSKKDDFEKHGDNDMFVEDQGGLGPSYGAAQVQSGYPGAQPAMYGTYQQTQVQYAAGSAQYNPAAAQYQQRPMGYGMPGHGAPAW